MPKRDVNLTKFLRSILRVFDPFPGIPTSEETRIVKIARVSFQIACLLMLGMGVTELAFLALLLIRLMA